MMTATTQEAVKVRSFHCPNCGGEVQLRGFAHSLTATCQRCLAVIDTSTSVFRIIQQVQEKMRRTPEIPLGSRGKFGGTTYELIGYQTRATQSDGLTYEWEEYLLFNPYKGFLYLTSYRGHWNVVRTLHALPLVIPAARPAARYDNRVFRHFQRAAAKTTFVLGEFPWRVQVGETAMTDDYVAPPQMLSSETTGSEVTWSIGEYTAATEIWKAFGLKDQPRSPSGVYGNQPNPNQGKPAAAWRLCLLFLLALFVLAIFQIATARREQVLNERHHFYPGQSGEQSFVTPAFQLKGRTSNVVIETRTDAENNWIYLNYALINSDTGHAYDFGREVSYYRDSDGSEGSRNDTVHIPSVPPGNYYLRVEPEGDANSAAIEYDIIVKRDVPNMLFYFLGGFALLIPPVLIGWRSYRFEYDRWQESDYPKVTTSSSGGDD